MNVNLPLSEYDHFGMTEKPLSRHEEDVYRVLQRECSVRDACGCKGTPPPADSQSFDQRMSTLNQIFEKGGLSQSVHAYSSAQCSRPGIEDMLTRYLHPQTITDIQSANSNAIADRQGAYAWRQVKFICAGAPTTIHEFYN